MDDLARIERAYGSVAEYYRCKYEEENFNYNYDDMEIPFETEDEPRRFEIDQEYRQIGFYGGVTVYVVKEISENRDKILLAEIWYDVDGTGTRPAEWHELRTDDNGNEMALEWTSTTFGDIYIYAY